MSKSAEDSDATGADIGARVPSLLDREATGGEIAEGGFSFQRSVLLAYIPRWLAQEGFSSLTQETYGDIEAKFYNPGRGYVKEFVEAKNHLVVPAEFWKEIGRFQAMAIGSPGTYEWFTLVSSGISDALKPLANGLRRVRGSYGFYEGDEALRSQSYADYERIVEKLGHSKEEAAFLFEHVMIEHSYGSLPDHGRVMFLDALGQYLPEYDLPPSVTGNLFISLDALVKGRINSPISRRELEAVMTDRVPENLRPAKRPVRIFTAIDPHAQNSDLVFEWEKFFGGADRAYPPTEEWNGQLVAQLLDARDWINGARTTRNIKLDGNRRLSASLAIGTVFSAVAGYAIDMSYRSEPWATDRHADGETPGYALTQSLSRGASNRLVVSIGIIKAIASDVEGALPGLGLGAASLLHLHGDQPVESPQHANRAVASIKQAIDEALTETGSASIDLFFAGPASLALFLGHRLNALAPIQCYEWVSPGQYARTCKLS